MGTLLRITTSRASPDATASRKNHAASRDRTCAGGPCAGHSVQAIATLAESPASLRDLERIRCGHVGRPKGQDG